MPLWLSSRLEVFRSRWRIQLSWRWRTPLNSWIISVLTSPGQETKTFRWPPHYVSTTSWITQCGSGHTGQEGLFHGLHETLQIMFNIIHHNVDFIHITAHDDLLQDKHTRERFSYRPNTLTASHGQPLTTILLYQNWCNSWLEYLGNTFLIRFNLLKWVNVWTNSEWYIGNSSIQWLY